MVYYWLKTSLLPHMPTINIPLMCSLSKLNSLQSQETTGSFHFFLFATLYYYLAQNNYKTFGQLATLQVHLASYCYFAHKSTISLYNTATTSEGETISRGVLPERCKGIGRFGKSLILFGQFRRLAPVVSTVARQTFRCI